jgi:hypothetical protein
MRFVTEFLRRIKAPWWALAIAASLVTMTLAGTVVVLVTPAGCRAAHNIGLQVNAARCANTISSSGVAGLASPSPSSAAYATPPSFSPRPTTTTTSPSAPPQPTPSPLPPYEYPTSSALPPNASVTSNPQPVDFVLSCRLPIYQGQPGSGGFIVFPAGSYVADPRSGVALPATAPSPAPNQYGGGFGGFGVSYDHAHDRWFPVPWTWAAPDGSRYVYPGAQGVYVVSAADNTVSELGEGKAWFILTVDAQGVYATVQQAAGLWFLPFTGAAAQQITPTGYWQAVGGGAAYGTASSATPPGLANPVIRFDLKTGASTVWFAVDQSTSQVIGFDRSGSPLISVNGGGGQNLWLAPSVGGATVIAALSNPYQGYQTSVNFSFPPIADGHGIWFGGQGIDLFTPSLAWYQASKLGGQLAGPCV